jgi:RND family efflux transporter MFP subunit
MDQLSSQGRPSQTRLYVIGVICVIVTVLGTAYYMHQSSTGLAGVKAAMEADVARGPRVVVANVVQGPQFRTVQLLGDARPYMTTTVFAKVSGYLKAVHVDKGDQVTANQVVAEIDSAELESQYQSALADLDQKQRIDARSRELLRNSTTSQQAAEQAETNYRMAQETVRNLGIMRSYQTLKAPFNGTVIARFADPGALMQAATTNQASSLPVLQIADNSKLRVGIYVEQRDVAAIKVGDEAEVVDAANAERRRKAKISRTAGTLDPRTRTLFVEIDLDNGDQFLVPGSFVYVQLKIPVKSFLQIPVSAVLQRGGAQQVAVIGEDSSIKFRPIKVASTDGAVINIAEGLKLGERVGLNVSSDLVDGAKVRPAEARR